MRLHLPRPTKLTLFAGILAAAFALLYYLFDRETGQFVGNGTQILMIIAESALLALPAILLRGRARLTCVGMIWAAWLFLGANMYYFRYWNDLLPLGQLLRPESYNSFVFKAMFSLGRAVDLPFTLLPTAVTIAYIALGISRREMPSVHTRRIAAAATVLCWLGAQGLGIVAAHRYWISEGFPSTLSSQLKKKLFPPRAFSRTEQWHGNELLFYLYTQAVSPGASQKITLSDDDRSRIRRFFESQPAQSAAADSIFARNRDKNLILIIVESLNADATGRRFGSESITPTLDSLLRAEGTISALNMEPQISNGISSDGQFIYNTGLLPIRGDAVAMVMAGHTYPTLVRSLGRADAMEVISEPAFIWNHSETTHTYGYNRLVSDLKPEGESIDACVFGVGLREAAKLKQPFLLELTTCTMHSPFADPAVEHPAWIKASSPFERRYFASLREFDRSLGDFLRKLRRSGLYDDSVIVIVSDHDKDPDNREGARHPIAFIALNTGVTAKIDRRTEQSDVFPTILQIMGRLPAEKEATFQSWAGVGVPMLNTDTRTPATIEEAWQVSDLIIRSDYFSDKASKKAAGTASPDSK